LYGIYPLPYVKIGIETQSLAIGLLPVFVKEVGKYPLFGPVVKAQNLSGILIIERNLVDVSKLFYFSNEPNFIPKHYVLILILTLR